MQKFLLIAGSNLLALYLASLFSPLIPGYDFLGMLEAAILLTIINWLLRPLLMLVALPLNLISLGFFVLVINAWMVMLSTSMVRGWQAPGFWAAMGIALLVMLCNSAAKRTARAWIQDPVAA
ncbi:MAG TPA: phage holin family protein [Syntrophomonadaceae bacterium]|nr:phage holin family protein [Syntrophomonadaceae bacterium]